MFCSKPLVLAPLRIPNERVGIANRKILLITLVSDSAADSPASKSAFQFTIVVKVDRHIFRFSRCCEQRDFVFTV